MGQRGWRAALRFALKNRANLVGLKTNKVRSRIEEGDWEFYDVVQISLLSPEMERGFIEVYHHYYFEK